MIYNFDKFDIVVDAKEALGMYYFIPKNFREIATKEEIHNAIDYCKNDLNIENDVNCVGYHKIQLSIIKHN